jgi:cyanate permease
MIRMKNQQSVASKHSNGSRGYWRPVAMLVVTGAWILSMEWIGFLFSTFVFLILSSVIFGSKSWGKTLLLSLVMPLVGNNWRMAFAAYGMTTFGIGLIWLLFAREGGREPSSETMSIIGVFSRLVKLPTVRIVLTMGLLAFAIGHGLASWLPKILETSGMSGQQAGFAASITVAAGIPSILIIPSVVPLHHRGRTMAILSILTAVNILLVMQVSGMALLIGLALLGFISSPFMSLLLLILMDSPGVETRHMGSAGGMFFCVAEIGGFAGPFFMGVLVDLTGTFMAGALFLAGLCIATAVLTCFLRR